MNTLPLLLVGLNYRTAPLEVRERLATSTDALPFAVQHLKTSTGAEEALVLSTCNRVEFLMCGDCLPEQVVAGLAEYSRVPQAQLRKHLYSYSGDEAVRHLFRVAASLDSMVVGEAQILGQLKEAYAIARECGGVQSRLDALLTRAFAVAKRVRTETMVGSSSVSVASTAVELATKIFGSLRGRAVLLVGAGKMIELAMRHLKANGAGETLVVNRTFERAQHLARKFEGKALAYESLMEAAPQVDIVITSTGAPEPIFRREHGQEFMQRRRNRPMFFIDIAVPRDVDARMNEVDGIFVYDIDDLQQVIASHKADRQREAQRAEAIVLEEVARFHERLRELHVVPTIVSLQDTMEMVRQAEIERVRGRLGNLTAEQEQAIETLTRGIVNKILHSPITALKSAAKQQQAETLVEHAERLFGLGKKKDSAKA